MCEGKEHAIAIGTMILEPSEIKNVNKGIGIEVAHYLNDGLWHLKHVKQDNLLQLINITVIHKAFLCLNHSKDCYKLGHFLLFRLLQEMAASGGDLSWYFSQVKGTLDDDVAEGTYYQLCFFIHILCLYIYSIQLISYQRQSSIMMGNSSLRVTKAAEL